MLRYLKRVLLVILALSIVLYGYGYYKTRMLRDDDGPVIEADSESVTISVSDPESALLEGIRAHDAKDGDVTPSLVVQGFSTFLEPGRRQAVIAAFDSDNNVTKKTIDVRYGDYTPPRFLLDGPLVFPAGTAESRIFRALRASDCLDGDLGDKIVVQLEDAETYFDPSSAGTTRFICSVTNSGGETAYLPVTVSVTDPESGDAGTVLLTQYLVYLSRGGMFDAEGFVRGIAEDGEVLPADMSRIRISDPVNTNASGAYEVVYSLLGEDGKPVSDIYLPVIVE